MNRDFPDIALHVPQLLLPAPAVSPERWAVIACDQHTAAPSYWEETARQVGDAPSALNLVLPEAHLGAGDRDAAVRAIHQCMASYLADGTVVAAPPGFMLVERDVGRSVARRGLLVALDLEQFDYRDGAQTLIRSTEGTDRQRLPARMAVRDGAALEAPHILVLIDDPQRTVIEPLSQAQLPLAYDFALMQGGGHVRGWRVAEAGLIDAVAQALGGLKHGEPPLLYAMGDGNHSFAAARAVWEGLRERGAAPNHPARYALVELVNLHDEALQFAPIHRLLVNVDVEAAFAALAAQGFARHVGGEAPAGGEDAHCIPYVAGRERGVIVQAPRSSLLPTASLQTALDAYQAECPALTMDYIHGDDTLAALAAHPRSLGFLLPPMDKHDLFPTVVQHGATPRKTFSLGEAHEKRYYYECRRIQP